MNNLIKNYHELKSNFSHFISNVKDTTTDKEKIINELNNIKVEYENKESRMKIQEENKK